MTQQRPVLRTTKAQSSVQLVSEINRTTAVDHDRVRPPSNPWDERRACDLEGPDERKCAMGELLRQLLASIRQSLRSASKEGREEASRARFWAEMREGEREAEAKKGS